MLPSDMRLLEPWLKPVSVDRNTTLTEPWDEVQYVNFPETGMISLLTVMQDGKAIETATIGREGVVGSNAGLGHHITLTRATVQTDLTVMRIAAAPFRKAVSESASLRLMVHQYNELLLGQVQITAACNALHTIEARVARWILQSNDRLESDAVPITQELLSEMLGVRRSSVSEIARKLQLAGLIQYSRGSVKIVDHEALKRTACECYATVKLHAEKFHTMLLRRRDADMSGNISSFAK